MRNPSKYNFPSEEWKGKEEKFKLRRKGNDSFNGQTTEACNEISKLKTAREIALNSIRYTNYFTDI